MLFSFQLTKWSTGVSGTWAQCLHSNRCLQQRQRSRNSSSTVCSNYAVFSNRCIQQIEHSKNSNPAVTPFPWDFIKSFPSVTTYFIWGRLCSSWLDVILSSSFSLGIASTDALEPQYPPSKVQSTFQLFTLGFQNLDEKYKFSLGSSD